MLIIFLTLLLSYGIVAINKIGVSMKRYRNIALICFTIAIIGIYLLLSGCATVQGIRPHCVPNSILCATTYAIQGYEARIAIFHVKPGIDHAQAQAKINGKWEYLSEFWDGEGMTVRVWKRNCPETVGKEPYQFYTVSGFIKQQKEALGVGL